MDFFLQDIRDKTEKYQTEILSQSDPKKPIASLEYIRSVLTQDLKSIIITNLKFKNAKIQYVTRITREKVELSEKNLGHDSHVIFQFDDSSIFYNKKKMNDLFRLQFTERVSSIIQDIEKGKTTVYEEIAPKVPYPQQESITTPITPPEKEAIPIIERKSVAELEMEAKRRRLKELEDQKKETKIIHPTHSTLINENISSSPSKSAELRQKYSPNFKMQQRSTENSVIGKAGSWFKQLFT